MIKALFRKFFSSKGEKEKEKENIITVQGNVNVSIVQNIVREPPPKTTLKRMRKLEDPLLELSLNYIINDNASADVYRVEEKKETVNAYFFVINGRAYAYIDNKESQLQPGVRTGGIIKEGVQFAIVSSHSAESVVSTPWLVLTGLTVNAKITKLTEDEITSAKKIILVG